MPLIKHFSFYRILRTGTLWVIDTEFWPKSKIEVFDHSCVTCNHHWSPEIKITNKVMLKKNVKKKTPTKTCSNIYVLLYGLTSGYGYSTTLKCVSRGLLSQKKSRLVSLVGRYYLTDREKSPTFFLLGRAKKLPWTPRVFSISSASRPVISLWNHLQIYTGIKTKENTAWRLHLSHTYTLSRQTEVHVFTHTLPRGSLSSRRVEGCF